MSVFAKKISLAIFPLMMATIGYLFNALLDIHDRVNHLDQKMSILVDLDNKIIPSPDNAIARMQIKDSVMNVVNSLDKRIAIIEWRMNNNYK